VKSAQPQFTPVHIEEITAGLAKAVNPTVVNAVQHLHWKFPAAFFAIALALIVAAGAWGYHFGYSTGYYVSQNALIDIPVGSEVGARLPAPEAEKWAALMRYNPDINNALSRCRRAPQDGRDGCLLPVWVTPPLPPGEQPQTQSAQPLPAQPAVKKGAVR
jgi:hypothetical protein